MRTVGRDEVQVIPRSVGAHTFEFAVLSGLRAAQLFRGCTPRIDGAHKLTVIAQLEVAAGKVVRTADSVLARAD